MVLEVAFVSGWILCSTTVLCVSALDMLVVYICGCSKLAAAIPDTLQLLICLILLSANCSLFVACFYKSFL